MNDETQEVCDFSEATYNSLEFNINEVSETLSTCSLGTGLDQVPGNVIRAISNNLSIHFLKLVQHIIATSEYPECWKLMDIKPIRKKGSTKNIENYSPVASLSKLSICFERLLFSKLYPIVESQIFKNEHGFLKWNSTSTQLT